ncbi:lactate utilization protein B/C [Cellulosimicrobium cellulans]|uniref:Lactate utilization protein B/C n=1 Tax=Cellulosimicrobium cellulans TaxID=1710 RepID=A0A1Y0HVS9_CELCE|nr:lactate utilization protein C [Cellulosimicrobium cellulans]ARU52110.1 lactate utilization protein B/C [Cellulosimicrobium cellulans]
MSARDDVLARVRAALGPTTAARPTPPGHRAEQADPCVPVPRAYRERGDLAPGSPDAVDVLVDRLVDYRAHVHVAATPAKVATIVGDLLADAASVVVPPGLDVAWLSALGDGTAVVLDARDDPRTPDELDRVDAVVTAARVAIADTGTIVLDGEPDQGRRAITLVPDLHVCVVRTDQVVQTVPEGVRLLAAHAERPQTWISGPSATSDIELSRVEGVHGPRTLHVILAPPR